MASPWDAFPAVDEPQGDTGGGPLVVTVAPRRQPKAAESWDQFPAVGDKPSMWGSVKSTATDVAQALPTGIIKGAIGMAGLPADAGNYLGRQRDALVERITGEPMPKFGTGRTAGEVLGSDNLRASFEDATGKLYEPQTTAGKFAQTVGEFVPGAGRSLANQARFALAPGIASEAAGQATEGTGFEPYARAAAAVLTGGAAAMVRPGQGAPAALAPALRGVDDAALSNARNLIEQASQRGVTLTWDEAINQVTGGATNLGAVRRVVEQSPEGAAVLRPIMAERPQQVAAAAGRAFDDVGPQAVAPESLGREVGAIAEGRINQVRDTINKASEPFYNRAEQVRLSPADMQRVQALPGYEQAARAVRSDPQLARYVQGMPEDSVGFLNEVKKQLDQSATNESSPVNAQQNMQRAAGLGSDAGAVRQVAEAASPDYATALAIQSGGRQQILQPILDGPIGKIASKDTTTKQALDALFPTNPLPGSANSVTETMTALVNKNPGVAQQLVRTHAESVFNQTAKALQGGDNVMGGAKFAAALRGNAQQAENLEASVRALPNGATRWDGFSKLLDIMEATGKAPAPNSATAQNLQIQNSMKSGGMFGEVANAVSTGGVKIPGRLTKWYEELQQGKNAAGLARLLVDRDALPVLRAIANAPPTSSKAIGLATRLSAIASQSRSN